MSARVDYNQHSKKVRIYLNFQDNDYIETTIDRIVPMDLTKHQSYFENIQKKSEIFSQTNEEINEGTFDIDMVNENFVRAFKSIMAYQKNTNEAVNAFDDMDLVQVVPFKIKNQEDQNEKYFMIFSFCRYTYSQYNLMKLVLEGNTQVVEEFHEEERLKAEKAGIEDEVIELIVEEKPEMKWYASKSDQLDAELFIEKQESAEELMNKSK